LFKCQEIAAKKKKPVGFAPTGPIPIGLLAYLAYQPIGL
jgi:hypothetical protein